jgi:uncharacterized BrkB/YihY/UPF0761 family membrane protein
MSSVIGVAKLLACLDRAQCRHPVLGVPFAVVYKFFDDQGNYLAAVLTYYAFIAIFPLLLIASSVLGFVLHGDPGLQRELLDSGLKQFPIIGEQLGTPAGLRGSPAAVAVGGLAALYGATGVAQASQNLMLAVWSVPRNSRPNPLLSRLRSLLLVLAAGVAFLGIAVLNAIVGNQEQGTAGFLFRLVVAFATVVISAGVFLLLFRLASAHRHSLREALPGAIVVALLWQGLQLLGDVYVRHVIVKADAIGKTFALVLGLIALIYLASVMAVLGAEVNVVLARRFYPRALLTPFTDDVELTEGDRRAYSAYAKGQRHKGFEVVDVTFDRGEASPPVPASGESASESRRSS